MATENIKIVDPDNGTGTDYTSLAAWEAGEEKDLQQADEIAVAKCRCTGGSADTDAVVIDGSWNTDETRYIKIWTDPSENYRHNGKWNESKYRLVSDPNIIDILEGEVYIEGIQVGITGSNWGHAIRVDNTISGAVYISQNVIKSLSTSASDWRSGITVGATTKIWNNVVYDINQYSSDRGIGILASGCTGYIYNNTVCNCSYGYHRANGVAVVKNSIAQDCTDGFYGSFDGASDYNISDISGDAPGANSKTCNVSFVDEANDDFHLSSTDTCAKDSGVDLSSDPNLAFSDDIDGETRSGTWDIGADEYVAAGGLIKIMDETVSISEGILRRLRSNRIINETISIAEALSRRAFSARIIDEALSITEAVLRRLRAIRIISETVSISESLVRRLRSVRVINETVGITEDFVRSCVSTVVKIMDETVSITETLVRRLYSKRIMDETVLVSEGILRHLRSVRTMVENISISEVLNRRGFLTKIINETVNVTETFVRSCIAGIVKIMNETVSVTESLMRKCVSSRVMQETLNILEALGRRCRMSRVATEMLSVAEAMGRRCRMVKVLNEAVSIVETMVRSCFATLVKIMSETVSVEESLTKVMTLIEVVAGKMSFKARRASASFKKFVAKIGFSKRGG
ncbi:hypothetical protein DRN85_03710 [Methanosarcinales archaeon]|nr:MAG: hypothetical protein DRN85_03710 [Methanosarcinales archaeon]